ncbi:hypothetical protein [Streptomyces sp. BPTC-684]|uniref:hypothetical protein n=1 Tax=Streptomyces sp. BPTC-684 TaxID=3043734 RepID=UPI0024B242F6|nr:hypothetical protein [Streptomyces sp. BPTC-684]WHM36533.1 hypothetical protein QIY60_06010 [Streptomyces sp. BPTC-684]
MSGTALMTAAAVLGGVMGAMPARADGVEGDYPQDPYKRSLRISVGQEARQDRCRLGNILHYTGPTLKAVVSTKLAGPDSGIHEALTSAGGWGGAELYAAQSKDDDAGYVYKTTFNRRQDKLDEDNKPYAYANSSGGRPWHAPAFGADIAAFTELGRGWSIPHLWDNPTPRPGAASLAKAKEVYDAFDTQGDDWATSYKEWAGGGDGIGVIGSKPGSANDIATFLRFGGFATKAPEPDSAEFRTEVEFLKSAWASCDSQNPIDQYRVLTGVTTEAYTEWEAEYASQATQRQQIVTAEAAASKEARTAADLMIEAIRQSWQVDQILFWQQWWRDHADRLDKPSLTEQKDASRRLVTAREKTTQLVKDADAAVAGAKTVSEQASASQAAAWAIADQNKVPRGRGLMYAQQSAQVAKASYAATQAAAKTVLTASKAVQANMADSQALYALAQTQSHAMNTEFRKAAALEAAAQAKAAADSAEKLAKEAAANATTAKNAQATAEKAEKTAQAGAAEAKKQRGIAEAEKANAEREAGTAASERKKAGEAEARAQTERDAAGRARSEAEASGSTASAKRAAAEAAEERATEARDTAVEAEKQKNATAARAAALEAAAAAAQGTDAAAETRQAATEARTAANDASAAAVRARTAANDASTAAVNARAAATRAKDAATRSNAAADSAWSAYRTTSAAAATSHAAAAVAIDAAATAKANADKADAEAKKAQAAAKKAREEADAAKDEAGKTAAWSAKTAGFAQAAALAAQGARDAATAVTKAADEAISIGSPYQELDASAAFAVLVGQSSKTLAEQQASAAEAKSKEAAKAAADAKALAEKAAGDAKIAAQAAATAAADAARAVAAAAAARASAAEADTAAKAAKKADDNAQNYAVQAGTDALYAGMAANDASKAAVQADRDATDAEKDAASANSAATAAESDAASARDTASTAERDATAAEDAAKNADGAAQDADSVADRAEEQERKDLEAARKAAMESGDQGVEGDPGADLASEEETILLKQCGQECVDEFRAARAAAGMSVVDWLKTNGAGILIGLIGVDNIKRCFGKRDIESCLWSLLDLGTLVTAGAKIPAVGKAIVRVSTGIGKFFEKAEWGKRTLERLRTIIAKAKKEPEPKPERPPVCKPKAGLTIASWGLKSGVSPLASVSSGEKPCDVTFPDPRRPRLGSDGKYHLREGDVNQVIDLPSDVSRTITDIDRIKDGVLWEEKTAVSPSIVDIDKWVDKQVEKKIRSYIEARQYIKGYEDSPIGLAFTESGVNTALRTPVEQRIRELRAEFPEINIRLWWPS